jgi:D-tyrosyl-tRNA(Tyr) deacylase
MRAVVQRVRKSRVCAAGKILGEIGPGLLTLLGVGGEDEEEDARLLANKLANLRIFPDTSGKMNLSLLETGGAMLIVSQFTLYGDCRKGRRPSYTRSALPDKAERLYDLLVEEVGRHGIPTAAGRFGTIMDVELTNNGPVTLLLDTKGDY